MNVEAHTVHGRVKAIYGSFEDFPAIEHEQVFQGLQDIKNPTIPAGKRAYFYKNIWSRSPGIMPGKKDMNISGGDMPAIPAFLACGIDDEIVKVFELQGVVFKIVLLAVVLGTFEDGKKFFVFPRNGQSDMECIDPPKHPKTWSFPT
jgi:hypothetical protein